MAGVLCGGCVGGLLVYRKLIQSCSLLDGEALKRKLDCRLKESNQATTAGAKSQREQLIHHTTEIIIHRIMERMPSFLPSSTRNAVKQYIRDTLSLDLSQFYDNILATISNETVLIPKDTFAQFTQHVPRQTQADSLGLTWSTLLGVLLVAIVISALSLSVYYLVPSAALLWRP